MEKRRDAMQIITELGMGVDLFDRVKSCPEKHLPEAEARHVFKQLFDGVAYLHHTL